MSHPRTKLRTRIFEMWFSPAFVVIDVAMVRVVRPVRYPPAVVRYQDERVRQVAWARDRAHHTPCRTASEQGAKTVRHTFCHKGGVQIVSTARRGRGPRPYQRPATLSSSKASHITYGTNTDTVNVVGANLTNHTVEGLVVAEGAMAAVVSDHE